MKHIKEAKYSSCPAAGCKELTMLDECASLCRVASLKCGDEKLAALCFECAECCDLAAKCCSSNTFHSEQLLELCKNICKNCAKECDKNNSLACQECADCCRLCCEMQKP